MAAETKTTKITVNTAGAQEELKALRAELKETRDTYKSLSAQATLLSDSLSEMAEKLDAMEKSGKKGTAEFKALEDEFNKGSEKAKELKTAMGDALEKIKTDTSTIKYLDDQLSKCDAVIKDLANSSLRQLSGATRESARQLRNMSENSEGLEDMHERMDKFARQTKIVKGEFVNVSKGIGDLSNQSDKWLSKAIKSQQDLVASLKKTDTEYENQLAILKQLEAEDARRKNPTTLTKPEATKRLKYVENYTEAQVKEAITYMKKLRDEVELGDEEWDDYARSIADAEKEMQRMKDSYKFMKEDRALQVLKHPEFEKESYVQQAIDSLEDLKTQVKVGGEEWRKYETAIQSAKKKLAELKDITPKLDNTQAASIARTGSFQTQDASGATVTQTANLREMEEAKKRLTQLRADSRDSDQIKDINEDLADLEERIKAVTAAAEKLGMSYEDAQKVMARPFNFNADEIKQAMDAIQKRIKELPAGEKEVDKLRKEYVKLEQVLKGTRMTQEQLNDIISRSKIHKASIAELQAAYKHLEQELKEIEDVSGRAFKDKQKDMQALKKEIDKVTGAAEKQSSTWKTAMHNLVAYVGLFGAFNMLKEKLTDIVTLSLKFSDQIADIRKVSGLATKGVEDLTNKLAKISTRSTIEELNQIAYSGAKLGLGQYGVEGLEQFVQAANQVNVALKEDLGEDALTSLSKITEVMGLIPKMGVEKSMLAVGSSMFKLASTSTATSENIVEFTKRLTGISQTAGITTDQLLALGAASDSMMLMPEVASTAFNKLITSLQRAPGAIEKSLEIPQGTIDSLFSAGKTMDAIVLILEKMKQKGNMNALDDVFKDLGSDGARLIQVMVTMSKNVNMLKNSLYTANEAFEEGTAVTDEYNIQQETAAALMERSANAWEKLFVNSSQTTKDATFNVYNMTKRWYELTDALTSSTPVITGINFLLGAMSAAVQGLIYLLPSLIALLGTAGVVYTLQNASKAFEAMKDAINRAREAYAAFGKAATASFWGGIAIAVASLAYTIYEMRKKVDEAVVSFEKLKEARASAVALADEETRKLKEYVKVLSDTNLAQTERERLIAKFNQQYAPYLEKLGMEINTVDDLKDAYARLNDEIRKKTIAEMRDKTMSETTKPLAEDSHNRYNELRDVLNKHNYGAIDARYVKTLIDSGKNTDQIFAKVVEAKYGTGVTAGRSGQVTYTDKQGKKQTGYLSEIHDAILNYVNAEKKYVEGINTVNDQFTDLLGDWSNQEAVVLGHLHDHEKPTKSGSGGRNPEKTAEQIAKDRANALIANIKAFYEEQQRKYLEWVAVQNADEEKVSEGQQKLYIEHLQTRMNQALGKARQSIATLDDGFKQFYEHMDEDVAVFDDETSRQLLESIGKSNIKELHDLFSKLSGDLSRENNRTLAENLGALLDQIFANGSKELREAAEKIIQRQRELQKIIMEEDYVGQATRQTRSNLDQYQLLKPTADVRADTTEGVQQISDAFDKMIEKSRKDIYSLYEIDPESKNFKESLVAFFSDVSDTFDFAALNASELHALYRLLIDDETRFEQAQKKQDEARKKVNDKRYSRNPQTDAEKRAIDQGESVVAQQGIYGNLDFNAKDKKWEAQSVGAGISQGIGTNTDYFNDPEIMLDRLRLESKQRYFEEIARLYKVGKASEDDYREAQKSLMLAQNQLAKDLASNIAQQTGNLMSFLSPLQSFGESVGEAFATMHDDAASGRKAVADALKSMTKSFAKATLDIIQQNLMRQLNNELTNSTMLLQDSAFAAGKQSIAAMMYANLLMQQAAFNGETLSMEAALTQAQVALDSAKATAKGFAQLGPIGGPVAIAAMMAVIGAALSYALSMAFKGSNDKNTANVNTKLSSGMLTYDSGNVSSVLTPSLEGRAGVGSLGGASLYLADNGRIYQAKEGTIPATGARLLTTPTATTVNGHRALVAENGPELVVGRETTRYIQQNDPELLRTLITYDRNHSGRYARRTYDDGNVADFGNGFTDAQPQAHLSPSLEGRDGVGSELLALLQDLRTNGIKASLDMWGYNGAMETLARGQQFRKRH